MYQGKKSRPKTGKQKREQRTNSDPYILFIFQEFPH